MLGQLEFEYFSLLQNGRNKCINIEMSSINRVLMIKPLNEKVLDGKILLYGEIFFDFTIVKLQNRKNRKKWHNFR